MLLRCVVVTKALHQNAREGWQAAATMGEAEACRHWLHVGAQQRATYCQQRAASVARQKGRQRRRKQSVLKQWVWQRAIHCQQCVDQRDKAGGKAQEQK
jgi:hypothetical protein